MIIRRRCGSFGAGFVWEAVEVGVGVVEDRERKSDKDAERSYVTSAVRRSWKSSSGVQEVDEIRSFVEPEMREER